MHTVCLQTVRASVATTRCCLEMGVGCPQVNKVEQVSSIGHQMSVAGEIGPRSVGGGGGRSQVWFLGGGKIGPRADV